MAMNKLGLALIGIVAVSVGGYFALSEDPVANSASKKKKATTIEPIQQKQGSSVRLVQAVTYEDAYAAASIIKRAMDQVEANSFVAAQTSLRVLRMEQTYYELQQKIANSKAQINKLEQGVSDMPTGDLKDPHERPLSFSERSYATLNAEQMASGIKKDDEKIRLVGLTQDGEITVRVAGEEYTYIRVGHVINQEYEVVSVDVKLGCVELKNKTKAKPTVICYQG